MRLSAAALIAVILFSAAATGGGASEPAGRPGERSRTQVEKTFLIPSSEGYGVGECLTGGDSACGQVVADSWCEAQGYAAAASYGVAALDDYTGAIADVPAPRPSERPIRITCRD